MSKGPGRVMQEIDDFLNGTGNAVATYRVLALNVYGPGEPTRWQLYSIGRACRRLVEMGRAVVVTDEIRERYNLPYGHDRRERPVLGIANGWPRGKWKLPGSRERKRERRKEERR